MGKAGLALDVTHMSEEACFEALDVYGGVVVASHAHSQPTVPRPRLLSDRVIQGIVARNGVIGVMPVNWALRADWEPDHGKAEVTLDAVVDAIDAVCQIAGGALHVGLGTDFDGGQGAESAPAELDTIADLPRLASMLASRGFTEPDVAAVMGGNSIALLRERVLPGTW